MYKSVYLYFIDKKMFFKALRNGTQVRYWIMIISIIIGFNSHLLYGKESNIVISKHDQASIITHSDFYDQQDKILLGLRLRLNPGWHTYWVNPGEAGDPATIEIQINGKDQKSLATIEWPVPQILSENNLTSYIYKNEIILPFYLPIPKQDHSKALTLAITANWLVCADVCVPEEGKFVINLPRGQENVSKEANLLQNALTHGPKKINIPVNVTPKGKLWLDRKNISELQIEKLQFMPEKNGILDQNKQQQFFQDPHYLSLQLPLLSNQELKNPPTGILILQDRNHQHYYWSIQPHLKDLPSQWSGLNIFLLLGSAFIGGCLLNFMPCVFPVIAMKLLSFSRMKEKQSIHRYKSSTAYVIGILCSFMLVAGGFMILRWLGHQLGWGIQFQSIGFLIALCWLLFLIALNFLNVFTVNLSFNASGQSSYSLYMTDFFTGILAVLVATPCTAPFMGMAIAAALNTTAIFSFLIFIAMGLGLSFPYVLLVSCPFFMRFLPKPGMWMEILRQLLAFPLLLTCVWLIWVINQHQQAIALLEVLLGAILIGFVAWMWGIVQKTSSKSNSRFGRKVIAIFSVMTLILLSLSIGFINQQPVNIHRTAKNDFIDFSSTKIEQFRNDHQPVFVNMTASWCLTCLVNEKVAISSVKVQEYLRKNHIHYMVGDWTSRNHEISQFLHEFNREGVPLYVYYPSCGEPKILPQILTPEIIVKNLRIQKCD